MGDSAYIDVGVSVHPQEEKETPGATFDDQVPQKKPFLMKMREMS
jgi:hypothetical protein